MSHKSNLRKNQTLGMPHGTAAGKLRKNVLFRQLKKHNENVCVRCGGIIQSPDDLSIEHIKPWEGISAELFWDLDNVAFSHTKCNRPHSNPGPKIFTPEGTAWCSKHQTSLPVSEFYKRTSNASGYDPYCKACRVELDERPNHAKKVYVPK
jgi:hypothetical protein